MSGDARTACEVLEEAAKLSLTVYGDEYTARDMALEWNRAKSLGEFEAASRIAHAIRKLAAELRAEPAP